MDVVHSLLPSAITSDRTGPRMLKRYLEYAEAPNRAIEGQVTVDPEAEPDSPFEESVEKALLARGYRIHRQVGVAGYRIDLAIMSEDSDGYDLGIECDGWQYHSGPCRERPRLAEATGPRGSRLANPENLVHSLGQKSGRRD